jgi:hypothetical protein
MSDEKKKPKVGYPQVGFPGPYEVYVPDMEAQRSMLIGFKTLTEAVEFGLFGDPTPEKLEWARKSDANRPPFVPHNYVEVKNDNS